MIVDDVDEYKYPVRRKIIYYVCPVCEEEGAKVCKINGHIVDVSYYDDSDYEIGEKENGI